MNSTKDLTRENADFAGRHIGSPAKETFHLQPPSLFQDQGFSTPPLLLFITFINVYDPISLSALGDHVYQ
jgi:hypothetical protein